MTNLPNERFHVGAYGILIDQDKILLIKKSRGAYKGMYDLPGGGIEFGEKAEEALKRELMEETGVVVNDYSFIGCNEYFCDYLNESQEPRKLHHLGLYYVISAPHESIKSDSDGEDSLGAEFLDINRLDEINISPTARPMIDKIIKSS